MATQTRRVGDRLVPDLVRAVEILIIMLIGWGFGVYHGNKLTLNATTPMEWAVIDPELEPYLQEFVTEAARRGIEVDTTAIGVLAYSDIDEDWAGVCYQTSPFWQFLTPRGESLRIYINAEYRLHAPGDMMIKNLLFHELGHCLLGKGHDPYGSYTIMGQDGIGQPYGVGFRVFQFLYWDRLVDDLFLRPEDAKVPSLDELTR